MELQLIMLPNVGGDNLVQLGRISINEDYRKKWNIYENDFVCLTKNSELIRNTLYRIGGLGNPKLNEGYFMLLKYVEAFYSDSITKEKEKKPHLEGRWCILDKDGNEKVEFEQFSSPYLVKNSQIYSIGGKYYNIENGEFYCHVYTAMESSEFLFLENCYDDDKSRRGVMKINKKDGSWVLFS